MENNEKEMEKDDIVNPGQFQVGRAPQEEKQEQEDLEDLGYTDQESRFADGEGTQLAEEFETTAEEEDGGDFTDENTFERDE